MPKPSPYRPPHEVDDHGGHPAHDHAGAAAYEPASFARAAAIFRAAGDV